MQTEPQDERKYRFEFAINEAMNSNSTAQFVAPISWKKTRQAATADVESKDDTDDHTHPKKRTLTKQVSKDQAATKQPTSTKEQTTAKQQAPTKPPAFTKEQTAQKQQASTSSKELASPRTNNPHYTKKPTSIVPQSHQKQLTLSRKTRVSTEFALYDKNGAFLCEVGDLEAVAAKTGSKRALPDQQQGTRVKRQKAARPTSSSVSKIVDDVRSEDDEAGWEARLESHRSNDLSSAKSLEEEDGEENDTAVGNHEEKTDGSKDESEEIEEEEAKADDRFMAGETHGRHYPYSFTRRPDPTLFPGAFIIDLESEQPSIIINLLNKLRAQVPIVAETTPDPPIIFTTSGNILDEWNSFFWRTNFSAWFLYPLQGLSKHVSATFQCEQKGCEQTS